MDQILDVILKNESLNSLDLRRQDFTELYSKSQSIISFLEGSIKETECTRKIEALKIPLDTNFITLRIRDFIIDKEQFQKAVDLKISYQNYFDDMYDKIFCRKIFIQERMVTVKMIDCGCFFEDGNRFPDFCDILAKELKDRSKRKIFESKFL